MIRIQKFVLLICGILLMCYSVMANDIRQIGNIYINQIELNCEDYFIVENGKGWVPFRSVLEGLNSNVSYDKETKKIYFLFNNEQYICQCGDEIQGEKYNYHFITIKNVENIKSSELSAYIQLSNWGANGVYRVINNRIYISQETTKNLFNGLGYNIELDFDEPAIKIDEIKK